MKKDSIKILKTAEEFGNIAKKVNESSRERKTHSKRAIGFIESSIEISEDLIKEIKTISKVNQNLRNQDNIVLNICLLLKSNLQKQKDIIKKLQSNNILDKEIEDKLQLNINTLIADIDEALVTIRQIIQMDNDIILMDNLILTRKNFQKKSIRELKKLATRSIRDAEKAIKGSSSNLDRGMKMVAQFNRVNELIKNRKKNDLNKLIEDARLGWKIAEEVNRSSTSQLEFAEKVNLFTQNLHKDSNVIKELVISKHEKFKTNLENITVLTVMLSLQFKNYMQVEEVVGHIQIKENYPEETRNLLNDLLAYIKIACDHINQAADLKYDMTDTIHLNADLEIKSVKLTNIELEIYESIEDEVNLMTEATKYPIEGSGKNIKNGQILENELMNAIKDL